jgi:ribosomal-protein-alanine N-acetyltransferase
MLSINFTPFPNLETERLYLRRVDKMMPVHTRITLKRQKRNTSRPLLKSTEDAGPHCND